MPEDSLRWFKAKRTSGNCSRPDRDVALSQSFTNGMLITKQMNKSAKRRLADIESRGISEGCLVRMNNTDRLRKVKNITADGRILMEGAERVCSPSDCTLAE